MIELSLYFGTLIAIYAIMALSLNLQYGFGGLLNFGLVAFFAIGAYASANFSLTGVPILFSMALATVIAGIAGALVAIPTMKLSVHYWAIVTISISELIRVISTNEEWLTGGTFGMSDIPQPFATVIPVRAYSTFFALFAFGFLVLCFWISNNIARSPFGRILKIIREDEDFGRSLGKDVSGFKLKTMTVGAAMVGLAGALYAHLTTFISPQAFEPIVTFIIWAAVILGGKGNLKGSILGAFIMVVLFNSTRFIGDFLDIEAVIIANIRLALIGLLIILTVLLRPDGLMPEQKSEF
uniref:branched-chain amino acid ABC transporter permease n=1 Tax=Pararhizobium sp. IMCC3301 TaxID=3067904 RepID=UPI002740E85A|nr:branched-chain amino acid ABC transporter permease [Pararhizobium sp. IMCC3301]